MAADMNEWNKIVKDLVVEQRMDCQYCFSKSATQGAHALVYRRIYNNRKKHKLIDVRVNFMPCCDDCAKFSETYNGRCYAWRILCNWYGDQVRIWYDGLNLKIKEIFE